MIHTQQFQKNVNKIFCSFWTKRISVRNMATADSEVLFQEINNKGIVTLNRVKALNALNLNMIRLTYPKLKDWEQNKDFILIKGSGEKAFCAGGDVLSITKAGKCGDPLTKIFFKEEYNLNCLIGTLHIPYIAIIDGITMGGGVGLSVHGQYRIATEKTMFAMPETGIGFFPDVGGTYFLPRLGGNLGTFLALTGHRLKGRDVLMAGVATSFCDSQKIGDLEKSLLKLDSPYPEDIVNVIRSFQHSSTIDKDKEFSLKSVLPIISKCFKGDTMEEIMINLHKENSDFSKTQLELLEKMSPTSLKVTLEALRRGENSTLQEALSMEYRLSQRFCADHDFYEGVRALLVDRDNNPKWNPSSIKDVSKETVEHYFSLLDKEDELMF